MKNNFWQNYCQRDNGCMNVCMDNTIIESVKFVTFVILLQGQGETNGEQSNPNMYNTNNPGTMLTLDKELLYIT